MAEPQISILVISRTAENMSRLLEAIESNGIPVSYEVLCSWNGDLNDVKRIDIPEGLDFNLVEQKPYNFARNNNALASKATGKFLLFINDDVIPDKGAIRTAYHAIKNPVIGMVGINLRYQNDKLQHAGIFFREDGTPYHRHKHQINWDDAEVSADMFVPGVTGAFIFIRREEFNRIRFDEEFNVCGEDIALNLTYREKFDREILYVASATALHVENATRKKTGETKTPPEDMLRIQSYSLKSLNGKTLTQPKRSRLRVVTEKPGWIMHRKALELQKYMGEENVRINTDWEEADIHYYINYGYYNKRPARGKVVANFTHYDPDHLADKFVEVAREVDHCIAVSQATAKILMDFGIPKEKISVILVGADIHYRPKVTLGIMGRIYPGGRKGEDLVEFLVNDEELMRHVKIVAAKEGWGVPVWNFDDPADFYRAIDYLLVPSKIEGGPVPFMEALACGTLSIAPAIGVIPQFPHIAFPTGDTLKLKDTILKLADQHLSQRAFLFSTMKGINWNGWAVEHEKVFRMLLNEN